MPDLKGTTRAQTLFLRGFRKDPAGPPPHEWPSPIVLRRWLRKGGFAGAMTSLLQALRWQADFHLTAAAASAGQLLHQCVHAGDTNGARKQIEALITLLRLAHIRHRFAEPLPDPPPPTNNDLIKVLRTAHPNIKVSEALQCIDILRSREGEPYTAGMDAWKRTGHEPPPKRYQSKT
jgi:hypothetical protein